MAKIAKDPSGGAVDASVDPLGRVNFILRASDASEIAAISATVAGVTNKSGAVRWALACGRLCREAGVSPAELARILAKHSRGARA